MQNKALQLTNFHRADEYCSQLTEKTPILVALLPLNAMKNNTLVLLLYNDLPRSEYSILAASSQPSKRCPANI